MMVSTGYDGEYGVYGEYGEYGVYGVYLVQYLECREFIHHCLNNLIDGEEGRPPVPEMLILPAFHLRVERGVLPDVLRLVRRTHIVVRSEGDGDIVESVLIPGRGLHCAVKVQCSGRL
jgi:hypothetical protein